MARFLGQYRRVILFVIAVVIFLCLAWVLRNILLPFILGLILAYLLLPIILWVEKRLPRKNRWMQTKRISLIALIYLIILAMIGLIAFYTIPVIVRSFSEFISSLPQIISDLINRLRILDETIRQQIPPQIQNQVLSYIDGLINAIGDAIRNGLLSSLSYISGTISLLLGFASLPMFLFYILKDAEKLTNGVYSGMSLREAKHARAIVEIIQDVLGRYIRSSIVLGISVGIAVFIGLEVLGIPFAPALAFWAAVTELVPILGPWLGGAAGGIVTLATNPDKLIWVIILYFGVQILEGNVLVPRIQGQYLQIHPAIILILIVVGGYFAGIWGIILIVPVTSTLIRLYRYMMSNNKKEELQMTPDRANTPKL